MAIPKQKKAKIRVDIREELQILHVNNAAISVNISEKEYKYSILLYLWFALALLAFSCWHFFSPKLRIDFYFKTLDDFYPFNLTNRANNCK